MMTYVKITEKDQLFPSESVSQWHKQSLVFNPKVSADTISFEEVI